jgi:hypothetical protein
MHAMRRIEGDYDERTYDMMIIIDRNGRYALCHPHIGCRGVDFLPMMNESENPDINAFIVRLSIHDQASSKLGIVSSTHMDCYLAASTLLKSAGNGFGQQIGWHDRMSVCQPDNLFNSLP